MRYTTFGYMVLFFFLHTEQGMVSADNGASVQDSMVKSSMGEPNAPVLQQEASFMGTEQMENIKTYRPLALKTNLLFDLASALNVEVEVPFASNWSVMADWTFPWWLWNKKQHCIEILSGSLEARYWINPNRKKQDRSLGHHNPLTGWFVGVYAGAGLYDLEWGTEKGYQGDFWHTGFTAGYTLPLSRNLGMEFSIGLGYFSTDWSRYTPKQTADGDWVLHCHSHGNSTLTVVPTKAKISFIWYPHIKVRK